MMKSGKVNLGWCRLKIREFIRPRQCFVCYRYGHMARHCIDRDKIFCTRCGEEKPKAAECPNEMSCSNCKRLNLRLKEEVDIKHDVKSRLCESYLREIDFIREKIDYGKSVPKIQ
ncbi:hypothetical protein AVEN_274511-1 [Araneus ventricosus]|uniref:CCHC-type domain-containing protein n=1 Tax=Araneus ventricosus TaxID=182803 RepID=A0A4Y2L0Z8_ARAVE|nr:hypothetical protein AVEN_274511-1 [Araneus ventricosus]